VPTKTTKSRRTIVMPKLVAERLRHHRTRQLEERLAVGEHWLDHGLVFCSRQGMPIHPENMGRLMAPFFEKAGCPPQRFHDLRHACASLLLAQGVSAKLVQETLGHTLISTTLDLYSHLVPELRQEVADRMDAVVSDY
jgi:integrase